jgi:hypothetical protein
MIARSNDDQLYKVAAMLNTRIEEATAVFYSEC